MTAPESNPDPRPHSVDTVSLSPEDLRRCTEVLEAIVRDRAVLTTLSEDERRALLTAAGRISRPAKPEEKQLVKAFRKAQRRLRINKDRSAVANAAIRVAREATVFAPPRPLPSLPGRVLQPDAPELEKPRNCYICKQEYRRLHHFYDSMCIECGDFNYAKRFQSVPLDGRVAIVTGARVKIGYFASLILLRAGATVVATTRFPHDAAQRYAREEDFAQWKHRLHVFGLDLRHSPSVEILCRYLNHTLPRLDVLINNACQTVRRPAGFYSHLLELETQPLASLSPDMQAVLKLYEDCKGALSSTPAKPLPAAQTSDVAGLAAFHSGEGPGQGLRASALMSQIRYTYDDASCGADVFPEGRTDADLQQIDLRTQNSWRMTLAEVPTTELLEVQLVNAVAPFILCSRLKPLFLRTKSGDQHIINVTAMEGIFSRGTKTDKHPHTNMAKAALNMMTLTASRDYINDGIHMNAVDTGWITDEDPAQHAQRKREEHDFQPPLDVVDGAARIVDPFIHGLISGEHAWGKFFKDYKPAQW